MDANVDILVVGAGISGIAFASTYLKIHPTDNLLLIEREVARGTVVSNIASYFQDLGRLTAPSRLYDHFYTQWSVGFGEFADQPMSVPPEEDQFCGLFKAKYTTHYLESYADKQEFAGQSIKSRVRFGVSVANARRCDQGWEVDIKEVKTSQREKITSRKLIVASGLFSVPNIPRLQGSTSFLGCIIHIVNFGSSGVLSDPNIKHVTVLGGGKSGADMVYACVKAGKEVAWIVRPSGTGPCTFVDANGKAGFNNAFELASTRAVEALQPSYFAGINWWTNFIHRSHFGQFLSDKLWSGAHDQAVSSADYPNRPSRGDFSRLVPHSPLFWRNNAAGIVNHPDFYEVIAGEVQSYYDDIKDLDADEVHLVSGRSLRTDCLLLGTGWQDSLDYLAPSLRAELGLPYPLTDEAAFSPDLVKTCEAWSDHEREADRDAISRYPALANPPAHVRASITHAPYRLYNLVVPVSDADRSFAAIGLVGTTNYFRTTEIQARWVTAYFDRKVILPSLQERTRDVAGFVAWCRRRYLSSGNEGNSINFDTLRYTDKLLDQMGLSSHVKAGWAFFFSPNRAQDYAGLDDEYLKKFGNGD